MFSQMMKTINATDNLYLNPQQQKEILDYARSLLQRFATIRSIQQHETAIVETTLKLVVEADTSMTDMDEWGWTSAEADLRLTLRAMSTGILMDDSEYAEHKSIHHLNQMFNLLDFPIDFAQLLFTNLKAACEIHLPADYYDIMAISLSQVILHCEPEAAMV